MEPKVDAIGDAEISAGLAGEEARVRERGHEVAAGVHEGDVLDGKYQVDRVLGAGGMGVVVAAHHLQLETKVALKFLTAETLASEEALGRFEREARAAAKISSQHVARVMDVGKLENGSPYMVMELLDGSDLSQQLSNTGPFAVELAVELVLQACEAIAEAHHLGIVHRDLKPANLFCIQTDGLPHIKVLDFGISKFARGASSRPEMAMTRTSTTMGSPLYMSPEQMESAREVDPRTDIWALGVILHELISGQPPFHGVTLPEVCLKIATRPPPPLRTVRPDAPAGLETAITRCLEKNRDNRFPDVAALATAIFPFGPERSRVSLDRIVRILRPVGASTLAAPDSRVISGFGTKSNASSRSPAETVTALGNTKDYGKPFRSPGKAAAIGVIAAIAAIGGVAGIGFVAVRHGTPAAATSPSKEAPAAAAAVPVSFTPAPLPPAPPQEPPVPPPAPTVDPIANASIIAEEAPEPPHARAHPGAHKAPSAAGHPGSAGASPVAETPPKPSGGSKDGDPFSRLQPM